jgi:hypothetical protein
MLSDSMKLVHLPDLFLGFFHGHVRGSKPECFPSEEIVTLNLADAPFR